jgi:large subunit ribosomal protein L6
MSRIGRLAIPIPDGVKIREDGGVVSIEGPKGKSQYTLPAQISLSVDGGSAQVVREGEGRDLRAQHGLARKLLANIVEGVSKGFSRTLEIIGVGYRADVQGQQVLLSLGYSHPIVYTLPQGVSAKIEKQTILTVESADKQLLGEVSAQIRALRPPEPYKGKGIKYSTEKIRRKAGKAAGAGGR